MNSLDTIIHWAIGIVLSVIGFFLFSGCAVQERVIYTNVYKDVYVPVKCVVITPTRPLPGGDTVLTALDIIEYVKKLEIAVKVCQ